MSAHQCLPCADVPPPEGQPPILQPLLPGQPTGTKPSIAGMLCPIPALLQSFTPSRAGRAGSECRQGGQARRSRVQGGKRDLSLC